MLSLIPLPSFVENNPGPSVAVAIVLVGLLGVGLRDLLRFSFIRVWAIATVAYQQSMRRRVWLIIPLVILGIVVVAQLQKSFDAQDDIRQTTMICLFATGVMVTLVTIILACTNLPREIESRVIYTVATKPATRLEIVLGKVIGFGRVSLWMIAVMGLFTWGYLHLRDRKLRADIANQLNTPGAVGEVSRATLEYYRDRGTLHARQLGYPDSLSMYAHLPAGKDDRWSPGEGEGEMILPFRLDRLRIPVPAQPEMDNSTGPAPPAPGGVWIDAEIKVRRTAVAPATGPATAPAPSRPSVGFNLLNADGEQLVTTNHLTGSQSIDLPEGGGRVRVYVPPKLLEPLLPPDVAVAQIYLDIIGINEGLEYSISRDRVALVVDGTGHVFQPTGDVWFVGRDGQHGRQLRGGKGEHQRVAIYSFSGQKVPSAGRCTFEVRAGVERIEEGEAVVRVVVEFINRKTGKRSESIGAYVETNQPVYVDAPAEVLEGGEFDAVIRTESDAWLGLRAGKTASLKLVVADQSFAWNLVKSLGVLWLMSLLVIVISVFASTFLSWPIAVVLTVMVLTGRWCAEQVGDLNVGRTIVQDILRTRDPGQAKAISDSVDALTSALRVVSSFLPDLSRFSAIQDIQRGVAVSPGEVLLPSLWVLLGFGLPMLVMAYVFLKYKEVAP